MLIFQKGSDLGGYGSWLYALNISASLRLLQCDANLWKMSYNGNIPHIWTVSVGGLEWRQLVSLYTSYKDMKRNWFGQIISSRINLQNTMD